MDLAESSNGVSFTLLRHDNLYIFQHRDDKPNISSPGLFAAFGGALENGEEPRRAAARELTEETSLTLVQSDLVYLGYINLPGVTGGLRYVFKAEIANDGFDVKEGQGKVAFTKMQLETSILDKFTITTRIAIQRYILGNG